MLAAVGRVEPMALTSELSIRFLRPAIGSVLWAILYTTVGFAFWAAAWAAATRSPWLPLLLVAIGLGGVVAWRLLRAAPRPAPAGSPGTPPSQA